MNSRLAKGGPIRGHGIALSPSRSCRFGGGSREWATLTILGIDVIRSIHLRQQAFDDDPGFQKPFVPATQAT
jgi:hypothetical protein